MRAKVQGTVLLECVVRRTAAFGDVQVISARSTRTFGLDQQAMAAARKWRFAPARASANPCPY